MKLVHCIECETPWGAILDRPGDTEADAQATILAQMTVDWNANWELDRQPDWPVTPPPMPEPTFRTDQVVWVSEADASWLSNHSLADTFLPSCWQPVIDSDLPDWFVRARRVRTAVLVDRCCHRDTHPAREHATSVIGALARLAGTAA